MSTTTPPSRSLSDCPFVSPTEAPKLYLDGLLGKKLKVRAGEPIDIKIPMSGAPQPSCEWAKNKKKIEPSKRTTVSEGRRGGQRKRLKQRKGGRTGEEVKAEKKRDDRSDRLRNV